MQTSFFQIKVAPHWTISVLPLSISPSLRLAVPPPLSVDLKGFVYLNIQMIFLLPRWRKLRGQNRRFVVKNNRSRRT